MAPRRLISAFLGLFLPVLGWSATTTPRMGLVVPDFGAQNWDVQIRNDASIIDSSACVLTRGDNVFTSSITIPGLNAPNSTNNILITNGNVTMDSDSQISFRNASGVETANVGNATGSQFGMFSTDSIHMGGIVPYSGNLPNILVTGGVSPSFLGSFAVQGSSANNTTTYSGFIGTTSVSTSTLWSLPKADGSSGQALVTDGSAHLSFTSVFSSITVSTITISGNQGFMLFYSSTVYDTTGSSATTSTSFVPTKTAITFTPKRNTSRVEISISGVIATSPGNTSNGYATIFRGSTNLAPLSPNVFCTADANLASSVLSSCGFTIFDTPATASSLTYTVEIKSSAGGGTTTWNPDGETGTITVKEWSY